MALGTTDISRIGYLKFLSLLIAYLPDDPVYTADSGRWTEAIRWLRDEYDDQHPNLFVDLSFSSRPGTHPYSQQVSEFLTRIQVGNVVEVMNPGYTQLKIQKAVQEIVRAEYENRVDEAVSGLIKAMASELLEKKRDLLVATTPPAYDVNA